MLPKWSVTVTSVIYFSSFCVLHYILVFLSLVEQAAMEREVDLEHRAVESSTALARIQVM